MFGFADLNDVAAVAALVLTESGHVGATYELASRVASGGRAVPPRPASRPRASTSAADGWLGAMFAYYDAHGLPVGELPLRAPAGARKELR